METTKWYKAHRKFSFTAKYCIELYEKTGRIPDSVFKPFLKSLFCHSKSEEKMFRDTPYVLDEHAKIIPSKRYSDEEKHELCKTLLPHMKEEEAIVRKGLGVAS